MSIQFWMVSIFGGKTLYMYIYLDCSYLDFNGEVSNPKWNSSLQGVIGVMDIPLYEFDSAPNSSLYTAGGTPRWNAAQMFCSEFQKLLVNRLLPAVQITWTTM